MTRVLIVDDEPPQLRLTAETASQAGFTPILAHSGREALELLRADRGIAAVLLDLVMPDLDGMAVLETMAREGLQTPVIVQAANSSPETIASAMRNGAVDFIVKPVPAERLTVSLRNAMRLDALETQIRTARSLRDGVLASRDIVAQSEAMARVLALVAKAAKSPLAVLIEGENGVGKELVARVIQGLGERAFKPFICVYCGDLPFDEIEATLFGVRKGGPSDRPGKFQQAHGGTLFIDEVGELSLETQAKLLRVVQGGEIEPVGSSKLERVNVRIIAATNRRLLNLAKSGDFREDLYYRLNVLPIYVPPLRERREDIPELVGHFIARLAAEAGRRITGIAPDAIALLQSYDWPGNIRQLENTVYRAVVLCRSNWLETADFPQILAKTAGREAALLATSLDLRAPVHIDQATGRPRATEAAPAMADRFLDEAGKLASLAELERQLIIFAIDHHAGRMSRVARALKIGRSTLYRKLKEYGLDDGVESDAA
ncbi:MAG: Fis family transcriptional regulator [Hyphomicrobiales bacterium]|nr:Fis family transcriptional regulator [Hyphomicrobiales bacterium]